MKLQHRFDWKRVLLFFLLFIIGACYRILLIKLLPQPFWFDQLEYHRFALSILSRGLFYVESSRAYGYPLVIAMLYSLFGTGHIIWQVFNIFTDTATAFIVFAIVKRLTRSDVSAWISLTIALFNPFTAAYTGMLLTEAVSVFLMACILLCFMLWIDEPHNQYVYVLAALLGFLPQVRPGFLYFSITIFVYILWRLAKTHVKVRPVLLAIVLFCISFLYPVIGNYRTFGVLSATTVDNLIPRELYISLSVKGPSPHPANSPSVFPVSVQRLYNEYSKTSTNSERRTMATKYWNMSMNLIRRNPVDVLFSRIAKFWYVWQKTYIFYFSYEPEWSRVLAYWLNIAYIALAAVGYMKMKLLHDTEVAIKRFLALSAFLIIYIAVVHSVTLAEERYSLPGYPVLWIFAGYGIVSIVQNLKRPR